jgi:hypothetical protein
MDETAVSAAVAVSEVMLCRVTSVEQAQMLAQILEKDDRNALNELQVALQSLLGGGDAYAQDSTASESVANKKQMYNSTSKRESEKSHLQQNQTNHNTVKNDKKRAIEDGNDFGGAIMNEDTVHYGSDDINRGGKKIKVRR